MIILSGSRERNTKKIPPARKISTSTEYYSSNRGTAIDIARLYCSGGALRAAQMFNETLLNLPPTHVP